MQQLLDRGIATRRGIMAAHLEPACADLAAPELPVTERLTRRSLILPLFHGMDAAPGRAGGARRSRSVRAGGPGMAVAAHIEPARRARRHPAAAERRASRPRRGRRHRRHACADRGARPRCSSPIGSRSSSSATGRPTRRSRMPARACGAGSRAAVVELATNVGSHAAIRCGLRYARGEPRRHHGRRRPGPAGGAARDARRGAARSWMSCGGGGGSARNDGGGTRARWPPPSTGCSAC